MKTILVADDAMFMRMKIKQELAPLDCQIIEAENGQVALDLFKQYHPDLVLLDISMPVMDGLTALDLMHQECADIPVVICSAIGQESQMIKALNSGAKEFVVKPFSKDQLLKAVEQFL